MKNQPVNKHKIETKKEFKRGDLIISNKSFNRKNISVDWHFDTTVTNSSDYIFRNDISKGDIGLIVETRYNQIPGYSTHKVYFIKHKQTAIFNSDHLDKLIS
jgi:hypothetical protein